MVNPGVKKYWSSKIKYLILAEYQTILISPQKNLWLIPLTVFRQTVWEGNNALFSPSLKSNRGLLQNTHWLWDKHIVSYYWAFCIMFCFNILKLILCSLFFRTEHLYDLSTFEDNLLKFRVKLIFTLCWHQDQVY